MHVEPHKKLYMLKLCGYQTYGSCGNNWTKIMKYVCKHGAWCSKIWFSLSISNSEMYSVMWKDHGKPKNTKFGQEMRMLSNHKDITFNTETCVSDLANLWGTCQHMGIRAAMALDNHKCSKFDKCHRSVVMVVVYHTTGLWFKSGCLWGFCRKLPSVYGHIYTL